MRVRTVEIGVGLLMLAGCLALAILALRVSGLQLSSKGEQVEISASFEDVGSLKPRAKVTMYGVQIGEVTGIHISDDGFSAVVDMSIGQKYQKIVPANSSAAILTEGLIGGQFIGINPGSSRDSIKSGDLITDTQAALSLNKLVSQFMFNKVSE